MGARWLQQCTRKRHVATRAEAERAASDVTRAEGDGVARVAYPCGFCGAGWLVGTPSPGRRHVAGPRPAAGRRRVGWEELKRKGY